MNRLSTTGPFALTFSPNITGSWPTHQKDLEHHMYKNTLHQNQPTRACSSSDHAKQFSYCNYSSLLLVLLEIFSGWHTMKWCLTATNWYGEWN